MECASWFKENICMSCVTSIGFMDVWMGELLVKFTFSEDAFTEYTEHFVEV